MTMITPSYLGETIEYSSLHACRSTLEDPTAPRNGPTAGTTRPMSDANPSERITRPGNRTAARRVRLAKTVRSIRVRRLGGWCSATVSRASSRSVPYSTPEGHTGSQARHPRHRSIWVRNASEAGFMRPSTTCRMRCKRPRGESFSSPSRV